MIWTVGDGVCSGNRERFNPHCPIVSGHLGMRRIALMRARTEPVGRSAASSTSLDTDSSSLGKNPSTWALASLSRWSSSAIAGAGAAAAAPALAAPGVGVGTGICSGDPTSGETGAGDRAWRVGVSGAAGIPPVSALPLATASPFARRSSATRPSTPAMGVGTAAAVASASACSNATSIRSCPSTLRHLADDVVSAKCSAENSCDSSSSVGRLRSEYAGRSVVPAQ